MRQYNFMEQRKLFGIISVLAVAASIAFIAIFGIQMNVDFEGGTKVTVVFREKNVDIGTLRAAVTKAAPKAVIVRERDENQSRFSLKIKNPDVAKGQESEASLARRLSLEKAFASINNEERDLIAKVQNAEVDLLANKLIAENIYDLVETDAKKEEIYKGLAQKLKTAAAQAQTLDELAVAADAANQAKLRIGLGSNVFPALNHMTTDALNAYLKKYDPLGRGGQADYADIAEVVKQTRASQNDFITSFDELKFESVVAAGEDAATLDSFFRNIFVLSDYKIVANETFSPSIASELLSNAEDAILLALIGILLYIAFRFDFNYAVASVVALAHDVVIALGVFAVAGMLWGVELSNPVVAAFLTIVGYSLNDTIVVFDRIRDNRSDVKNIDLQKIMNTSINQTLSRTVVTSLTTFFVVAVIYWFSNNSTLEDFAFPLLVGIIVGTYSSIFVASPVLLFMTDYKVAAKTWRGVKSFFKIVTFRRRSA